MQQGTTDKSYPARGEIRLSLQSLWVVFFIYLSIFVNSYVFFKEPFELYIGYLIYIVLLPVFIARYGINRYLLYIFLILLFAGLLQIMLDNNTVALFFKVFTGLTLSYFFYSLVIVEFDFDVEQLFKWYLIGCYVAALVAIVQFISYQVGFVPGYNFRWIFNKWGLAEGGIFGIRINGFFPEPSHLGTVLSAGVFIALYNLFRARPIFISRTKSVLIIVAYLLSFSAVAQLGIFFALILFAVNFGLVRYIAVLIPAVILLFNFLYNNVPDFRDRYDSAVGLFQGEEFELGKTHGSSFILYDNYHVTMENLKTNWLFGGGIGSHPIAFDRYSLSKKIDVYGFSSNAADANSMLLRLLSETGLFGTAIFVFILFRFYVSRKDGEEDVHWLISNALLSLIVLNLVRQGHYFLHGFPFFVLLYIYNYLSYSGLSKEAEGVVPAGQQS